jgi:hypothetical protein
MANLFSDLTSHHISCFHLSSSHRKRKLHACNTNHTTARTTARLCQHTQHKVTKYTYAPVLQSVKRNTITIAVWAVVLLVRKLTIMKQRYKIFTSLNLSLHNISVNFHDFLTVKQIWNVRHCNSGQFSRTLAESKGLWNSVCTLPDTTTPRLGRFTPGNDPVPNTGGWVGPRAGLDTSVHYRNESILVVIVIYRTKLYGVSAALRS